METCTNLEIFEILGFDAQGYGFFRHEGSNKLFNLSNCNVSDLISVVYSIGRSDGIAEFKEKLLPYFE